MLSLRTCCRSARHGWEGSKDLSLLSAITALASVIVTGSIAVFTLQRSHKEANSQRRQQYLLAILPRRLDALENTWRMTYELESGMQLTQERSSQLVDASIWLPRDLKDELITVIAHPDKLATQRLSSIRRQLEDASGAPHIDALQSTLIEVPSSNSQRVK